MRSAPRVEHRLLVPHPRRDAILLEHADGRARLPAVETEDRHTAEVDYLNEAARQRLGLVTTVLRSLDHSDPQRDPVVRTHELELHGADGVAARDLSWCALAALPAALDRDDREAIRAWSAAPHALLDGREWTRPGWLDEARAWLASMLPGSALQIVQLRTWASSCVLRVRSEGRDYYFKAVAESLRRECALTGYLAREFPDALPRIAAQEPGRRWLLLEACPGEKLEHVADLALWERAAARYGALQRACTSRVDALSRAGCATRTLAELREGIDALVADTRARDALRLRCGELEAHGVPASLEHGDLWPGNFFVDAHHCALIDWEDAAVGHPFLSLAPLRVGLGNAGLDSALARERLDLAYLTAFAGAVPGAGLRAALRAAAPLAFVDMALRYRGQPPSVARLHPWMRDLVPQTLRLALELLE